MEKHDLYRNADHHEKASHEAHKAHGHLQYANEHMKEIAKQHVHA